jgi:hypothetical protein
VNIAPGLGDFCQQATAEGPSPRRKTCRPRQSSASCQRAGDCSCRATLRKCFVGARRKANAHKAVPPCVVTPIRRRWGRQALDPTSKKQTTILSTRSELAQPVGVAGTLILHYSAYAKNSSRFFIKAKLVREKNLTQELLCKI